MIHGIGTDIVAVKRLADMHSRHGERCLEKLLAANEIADCHASGHVPRFLAKRFAAKEALGKALGTGIRTPVLLTAIAVTHDELGKPLFRCSDPLTAWLSERRLHPHLSLSDEEDYALAFVVVETLL